MMYGIVITAFVMVLSGSVHSAFSNNGNLSAITWKHAVNSQKLLNEALASSVQMIEADIVEGYLDNDANKTEPIPVMGHPPANHSDISLQSFLTSIQKYNEINPNNTKGVKLDFKTTAIFIKSRNLLKDLWKTLSYPLWINADIIPGPVNNTQTEPVDPDRFLTECHELPNSTLSIGWTTQWGSNYTVGSYTSQQIDKMLEVIKTNNVNGTHPITFPVRAGIAAQSIENLQYLVAAISKKSNPTLTIWSSPNDSVNIDKLRQLILTFGVDRVYIDVPDDILRQLDLGNACGRASSLIHFGIVTMSVFLLSIILSNCQF